MTSFRGYLSTRDYGLTAAFLLFGAILSLSSCVDESSDKDDDTDCPMGTLGCSCVPSVIGDYCPEPLQCSSRSDGICESPDGEASDSGDESLDCGNGVVNYDEDCDGADLNEETCISLGADVGQLACRSDCTFDLEGCSTYPQPSSGDYSRCTLENQECTDDLTCKLVFGLDSPTVGFCSRSCASLSDCSPSPGGTAAAACAVYNSEPFEAWCVLDCSANRTCPLGMECTGVTTMPGVSVHLCL